MKGLTWNDIAEIHDHFTSGRRARTLPMDEVAEWADSRTDLFYTDEDGRYLPTEKARKVLGSKG